MKFDESMPLGQRIEKGIVRRIKSFLWPRDPDPLAPAAEYVSNTKAPMFIRSHREPVPSWEPIEDCPIPPPGRRNIHAIAITGEGLRPTMAIAFRNDRGEFHYDAEGKHRVNFRPNWFGDAPYFPPLPAIKYEDPWQTPTAPVIKRGGQQ